MLRELYSFPEEALELTARELHDFLGGPTLFHLEGAREPSLFVSVLMHGNETTGWDAVKQLLKTYYTGYHRSAPRSLSLFIANTAAAKQGLRHLPDQPDFNRVWPGSELAHTAEHKLMSKVVGLMRAKRVFASIDIHNNTGLNPHYACVNRLTPQSLHLASLFSRTVVYFTRPVGVQSTAMTQLCPAVTLECGKAEHQLGAEHALQYLDACVHLNELPSSAVPAHDLDLFHTTATVKIPAGTSFGFSDDKELVLVPELEKFNFRELARGTRFAKTELASTSSLAVIDEYGEQVFDEYFRVDRGHIVTKKKVMPSMLTRDLKVIEQDCLCYLMERYPIQA